MGYHSNMTPRCHTCGTEMYFIPGQRSNIGYICPKCPRPEPKPLIPPLDTPWRVRMYDELGERVLNAYVTIGDTLCEARVTDTRSGGTFYGQDDLGCESVAIARAVTANGGIALEVVLPGKRTAREWEDFAYNLARKSRAM